MAIKWRSRRLLLRPSPSLYSNLPIARSVDCLRLFWMAGLFCGHKAAGFVFKLAPNEPIAAQVCACWCRKRAFVRDVRLLSLLFLCLLLPSSTQGCSKQQARQFGQACSMGCSAAPNVRPFGRNSRCATRGAHR